LKVSSPIGRCYSPPPRRRTAMQFYSARDVARSSERINLRDVEKIDGITLRSRIRDKLTSEICNLKFFDKNDKRKDMFN